MAIGGDDVQVPRVNKQKRLKEGLSGVLFAVTKVSFVG